MDLICHTALRKARDISDIFTSCGCQFRATQQHKGGWVGGGGNLQASSLGYQDRCSNAQRGMGDVPPSSGEIR